VKVLGFAAANSSPDGQATAVAYLTYLARHPATARRIATKLALRFVSDDPPTALIDRLAKAYRLADTAIGPVLRALFTSEEFYAAAGQKVRRPYEDVIATIRTLGIGPPKSTATPWTKGLENLYWMVDSTGMAPLAWHPPDGYPDVAAAWQSAAGMLGRWNCHVALGAAWWPDVKEVTYPAPRTWLPATLPTTYGGYVDALSRRLVYTTLPTARRNAVLGFLGKTATDPLGAEDEAVGWRLPYVAALILDSPAHEMR
jgi:hypothetical protein